MKSFLLSLLVLFCFTTQSFAQTQADADKAYETAWDDYEYMVYNYACMDTNAEGVDELVATITTTYNAKVGKMSKGDKVNAMSLFASVQLCQSEYQSYLVDMGSECDSTSNWIDFGNKWYFKSDWATAITGYTYAAESYDPFLSDCSDCAASIANAIAIMDDLQVILDKY